MRFVCDEDVDADVAKRLRSMGHDAWTIGDAGHASIADDDVAVYAHKRNAVVLSHDIEFSARRRAWIIGQHIWLRCVEYEAVDIVERHLPQLLSVLEHCSDVWIRVSSEGYEVRVGDQPTFTP